MIPKPDCTSICGLAASGPHKHDINDARLEHHNKERREEEKELWEHHQVNVVQFLIQVFVVVYVINAFICALFLSYLYFLLVILEYQNSIISITSITFKCDLNLHPGRFPSSEMSVGCAGGGT